MTTTMTMRRVVTVAALAATTGLTGGCLDLEQTLTLAPDLSGTAGLTMKVDLEPMVEFMARMSREMAGKSGDPTPEEIEEARADLRRADAAPGRDEFEKDRRELERTLPPGVRLLEASFEESGLTVTARLQLAFDKVSSLRAIRMPETPAKPGGQLTPPDSPFDGLEVVEAGDTLLVRFPVQNPMSGGAKAMGPLPGDADTAKQIQQMFRGLRVAYRVTTPFEPVEHTAHRREGQTLVWEYDLKKLMALTPKAMKAGVQATYRRR